MILKEIAFSLKTNFEAFLKIGFINELDYSIISLKKLDLYNNSKIFNENFGIFLKNIFFKMYKERRLNKINTIFKKILNEIYYIKDFDKKVVKIKEFFRNKKFKMPWCDEELKNYKFL